MGFDGGGDWVREGEYKSGIGSKCPRLIKMMSCCRALPGVTSNPQQSLLTDESLSPVSPPAYPWQINLWEGHLTWNWSVTMETTQGINRSAGDDDAL